MRAFIWGNTGKRTHCMWNFPLYSYSNQSWMGFFYSSLSWSSSEFGFVSLFLAVIRIILVGGKMNVCLLLLFTERIQTHLDTQIHNFFLSRWCWCWCCVVSCISDLWRNSVSFGPANSKAPNELSNNNNIMKWTGHKKTQQTSKTKTTRISKVSSYLKRMKMSGWSAHNKFEETELTKKN